MHLDATTRKPIAAYRKALDEVKNHVMTELKASVVITKEIVFGSANDLPLKEHSHQYKAKTLVDIMENVALDTVPWESIAACLANDRNAELPPHFRTDICADTSFVLQIASIKTATGSFGAVIKHFIFAQKTTSLRNIDEVVHGTGYLTDYSPSFRRGPCAFQILLERTSRWMVSYRRLELQGQAGQKLRESKLGLTTSENSAPDLTWVMARLSGLNLKPVDFGGPLHDWSTGLVKECLRSRNQGVPGHPG